MLTNQNTFLYIRSNVLNYRHGPFFPSMESGLNPKDPYIIKNYLDIVQRQNTLILST